MRHSQGIKPHRLLQRLVAVVLAFWSVPGLASAVELEILGDMTSPHGGFGTYQNLLKWSEVFNNNPPWAPSGTVNVVQDGTTVKAPDGSTTADQLSLASVGVDSVSQDSGVASTTDQYTFSIWLRLVSGISTLVLKVADANENNTTVVTSLSSTTWERYSVSHTFATAGGNVMVTLSENAAGDAPVILVWGAQLEKSNKPNVYVRTDSTPVSSISQGLAVGKNVHVTGTLEVHGSIVTHGTGGPGGTGDLVTEGNLVWNSGTTSAMTFDHNLTSPRTITFPDVSATVITTGNIGDILPNGSISDAMVSNDLTASIFAGPGSLGNAVDLGTAEVAGNLFLSSLTDGATLGVPLLAGGAGADPAYAALNLANASAITNALPLANLTDGGTTGVPLVAGGTTGDPVYQALNLGSANSVTGLLPNDKLATITAAGKLEGTALASLASIPATAGIIPAANTPLGASIESGEIVDGQIVNVDIADGANIADIKLATITAAGKVGGTALANLNTIPATAGIIPAANTPLGASIESGEIVDGQIINLDISANPADRIAGTKITPDFGAQNLVTTGTLAAGGTSVSGNLSVRSSDRVVMDSNDTGDAASNTYMVHENTDPNNRRIRLYVDGAEVARFKK